MFAKISSKVYLQWFEITVPNKIISPVTFLLIEEYHAKYA